MSGPLLLPTWEQLATRAPDLVATMRRYLQQIGAVLRPGRRPRCENAQTPQSRIVIP